MSMYSLYNESLKIKMREDQLNIKMISQVFDVFPNSIILIADDGSVETADPQSGKFSLQVYLSYKVQGNPLNQKNQSAASFPLAVNPQMMSPNSALTPTVATTRAPKGVSIKTKWPAKPPGVSSKEAMEWTKTIEVNVLSHGELKRFSNFPIALTDATATISHVANQLSCEVFGGKKVILLDNDNLPIPDTKASRGYKFWKTNKKIRALTEEEYHCYQGLDYSDNDFEPSLGSSKRTKRLPSPILLTSSDDDDIDYSQPCSSKGKTRQSKRRKRMDSLEDRLLKLEKSSCSSAIKSSVLTAIEELLKCCICKQLLKPDCFFLSCCCQLVCEECIKQWFETNTAKTCPLCRSEEVNSEKKKIPRCLNDVLDILGRNENGTDATEL